LRDAEFSDEFCLFVQTAIPSIEALELLLAVVMQPDISWEPPKLAMKLRPALKVSDEEAAHFLEKFRSKGLLVVGRDSQFRYRPASDSLAALVQTLTRAYAQRPVTLIRMIYAVSVLERL
jgi:hypothetical protein